MFIKYLDGEKAANHILKQLDKHRWPYRLRGSSVVITCPFHESPSYPDINYCRLSINLESKYHNDEYIPVGLCRCWSCGKVCFFNDLITNPKGEIPKDKVLSFLKPLPQSGTAEDNALFSKTISFDDDDKPVFHDVPMYWREKWKGRWRTTKKNETPIEEETLLKMGCYSYFDYNPNNKSSMAGVNRLLFYAYDANNEKIGWIALADDEARKHKYVLKQRNMGGEWVSKTVLFHEKMPDNVPLILTEGPYDALRLIQEGFYAVCLLGAGNWTDEIKNLVVSKASHLIILFDGDSTGYEKSKKVYKAVKKYIPTKRVLLPIVGGDEHKEKNLDPGNMPHKYVKALRKLIKKFVAEN